MRLFLSVVATVFLSGVVIFAGDPDCKWDVDYDDDNCHPDNDAPCPGCTGGSLDCSGLSTVYTRARTQLATSTQQGEGSYEKTDDGEHTIDCYEDWSCKRVRNLEMACDYDDQHGSCNSPDPFTICFGCGQDQLIHSQTFNWYGLYTECEPSGS